MTDVLSLVKSTGAYKIIKGDKKNDRLSHAYLITCNDEIYLRDYLKAFVKTIACENDVPCNVCRTCRLIDEEKSSDVYFYPKGDKALSTEEVGEIIDESFIRPIESDKKIFVIIAREPLSLVVQNKLLKTLEEPPKGVHIVIGALSEFGFLSTVLSRVRKLAIPSFPNEILFDVMKDMGSADKVRSAISSSIGTLGDAVKLLNDESVSEAENAVADVLCGMKSSKDVLSCSVMVSTLKCGLSRFLQVLELALADIERSLCGGVIQNESLFRKVKDSGFNLGSVIYAIDKTEEALKRKKLNANAQMLTEWLLFQILEGKYKWRKL